MVTTQPLSFNPTERLRAPSFSSYLNSTEKNIMGKLAEDPNSLFHGAKKVEEGEIGVFGAERYFNGLMSEGNQRVSNKVITKTQHPIDAVIDTSHLKPKIEPKIEPRTSCTYSESSWNSQSGLLPPSGKRNPSQRKGKKRNGKTFISGLGCSCSCDGKNSVVVDEKDEETNSKESLSCGGFGGKMGKQESIKTGSDRVDLARIKRSGLNPWVMEEIQCKKIDEMGNGLGREDCFSFPILNSTPGGNGNPNPMKFQESQEGKQRRDSWEAFGSYVLDKKNKNFLILEGKPTMWGWETEEHGIPRSSDAIYDNDNESEASSDLFEIESVTRSGNSFLRRNGSSDGMSNCVTQTTCYAPSEASIEWSVVTASAAEFSSAISDYEEFVGNSRGIPNPPKTGQDGKFSVGGKGMGMGKGKRRPGNLLGCKSYQAVRVAGDAYTTSTSKKDNLDSRRQYRSSKEGKGK